MSSIEFTTSRTGKQNVIYNGYILNLNRRRNDRSYWRCNAPNCSGRLTLVNDTVANSSDHNHSPPTADITVHRAKTTLKSHAGGSDLPTSTKHLVADSVAGLDFECRTKLHCQISSLGRMARRARHKAHDYPTNPRSLEDLVIPPPYLTSNNGDTLLLWNSGYTPQLRRS